MNDNALRQTLLQKRTELLARVDRLKHDLRQRDEPFSQDFAEQVVEQENLDVLHAIDHESRYELAQVEKALRRLDSGDYYQCSRCGAEIDPARLAALPYADRCIRCAD